MNTSEIPVLIVGGGAAGTMLSLALARYGIAARTVDRLARPASTSKAITVHARTAEIFAQIDAGLADRFVEGGIHNKGYVLHFVDADGNRSEVRPGIDFRGIDSAYPYILVHGQSDTEAILRDYLAEAYGRTTDWGVECTDVEHHDSGVLARLRHADGTDEEVLCRYLVAADGMNSRVRRRLGLLQNESDYAGTKMQNLDAFLHDFPDADDWVHYCAGTDHFIMIVKLPGGYFRLLLSDRGEAADPQVKPEKAFMNLVERHFDGVGLGEVVWHSKWESWVRLAHTYRDRSVFLAGDSAHVHSTTGGQGMNCCIQDAWNLAWKLAFVLDGQAADGLLDTYESERRPIAEQVIWAASSLHDIFMAHGKDIGERAERIRDPAFLDAVVGRCSGLSYTYRECVPQAAGSTELGGPQNGDRAPDAEFAGGRRLSELIRHTGLSLLGVGPEATKASVDALADRLRARFAAPIRAEAVDASASYRQSYASSGGELLLIRPDGYIGYRCPASDGAGLERYLSEYLRLEQRPG